MERIVYRKTLDVHKNGMQFTLQGFETADNMARVIEINLMASGDTIDFPLENVTAMMYVITPGAASPSINHCTIRGNTIVYEVLPIVEEGTTEMQLKLIETSTDGAKRVLVSPRFAVEVLASGVSDGSATQTTTFTALENAVAKANSTYNERLTSIEFTKECIFRAYYADGTVYETDAVKEGIMNGSTLLSKSYAVGDTGARAEEATDNAKYYSNVSRSSAIEARDDGDHATELLSEVRQHGVYTSFGMDFESGELLYASPSYDFSVNEENGELEAHGKDYSFEEAVEGMVADDLAKEVADKALDIISSAVEGISGEPTYATDLSADFEKPSLVYWDNLTAFTPYAAVLTTANEGFAIVHGSMSDNHSIIAWGNGDSNDIFMHTVSNGSEIGWNRFISDAGGTLLGSLGVGNGKGNFSANSEHTILSADKDADNSRQIKVANPTTEGIPLEDAVKFSEIIDGVKTDYKLFGEHNIASLLGNFNIGQIEVGTFKGIGLETLQTGVMPSIEFKNISPFVVFVLEDDGLHFFTRSLEFGYGTYNRFRYRFFQTWEEKKLTFELEHYSNTQGVATYPGKPQYYTSIDTQYFLAQSNKTYTYIAFGTAVGGENA